MTNHYKMNPRVDTLKYAYELEEGMLVLRESYYSRERDDDFGEVYRLEEERNNYIRFFLRYPTDGFMISVCVPRDGVWIVKEGYNRKPAPEYVDKWQFKFVYMGGTVRESSWGDLVEMDIDWTSQMEHDKNSTIKKVCFRKVKVQKCR